MASVTIRLDQETKDQAAAIVEDLGLDLSTVVRAFFRQIIRERRIPLNLSCSPAGGGRRVLPLDARHDASVLPADMDDEEDGLYDHLVEGR